MYRKLFQTAIIFAALFCLQTNLFAKNKLTKKLSKLEAYYEQARKEWKVPGMAIAIVKDDSLVFSKGFGVKDVTTKEPVDRNTIFAIASNTKAFTAAGLFMLAEEGKLSLDDKVTKYLPWFEMYSPFVTHQMTVRDLLCHRTGLKTFSGDLIWYGTDYSSREVVERARHLQPKYGFRESYGYSNIMYIAAGLIIEKISGQTWNEFMMERIFAPLSMSRTISSVNDLDEVGNYASCHNDFQDSIIPISYLNWDNAEAAGGILSSVTDISKWIKLQLNEGIYKGDTIFSQTSQQQMWSSHTVLNVSAGSKKKFPSTHFKAYGLGWSLFDYHGKKIVRHSGGYDGMISITVLVPEENLGFVILTNKNSSLYYPLAYKTLDVFLSNSDTDWSTIMLEDQKNRSRKTSAKRVENTTPSLKLEDYTGIYGGNVYGNVEVSMKGGELFLTFVHTAIFKGKLSHWHYDTFEIELKEVPSLPKGKVTFTLNSDEKVNRVLIDIPNPDFDFTELDLYKLPESSSQ